MLYKKDFNHLSRNFISRYAQSKNNSDILNEGSTEISQKSSNAIGSFFRIYLLRSSIHGVRYVVTGELKLFERLIWALIVILSIFATAYISILLANRFNGSPLQTVVESTIHPIYNILFPAVTICNVNRVDWTKIDEAKRKFIPNATKDVENLFSAFVTKMEILEFGNFDNFADLANVSLTSLDHINITELSEFFSFSCEEMFVKECWWRFKYFPCCEMFVRQKSEYGFCYAFNSVVNDVGLKKWVANEVNWPLRTSSFGDWSGLRVNLLVTSTNKVPDSKTPIGIQVITHYPFAWPNNGIFVPAGTSAAVSLKPKLSYAMPSTRRYDPISRECVFPDEADNPKYLNLPGLEYLMTNCLSACRQKYMVEKCNCSMDSLFIIGHFKLCKASDFHCLTAHNGLFNFENHVQAESDIGGTNQSAMLCSCIHECSALDYQTEILPLHFAKENFTEEMIILDVHFQHGTLIKYRTDVVYGWLDLLVAFGGIAGLFMGASVLSGVEFFYYFTIGFWVYMRDQFKKVHNPQIRRVIPIYRNEILHSYPRKIQN